MLQIGTKGSDVQQPPGLIDDSFRLDEKACQRRALHSAAIALAGGSQVLVARLIALCAEFGRRAGRPRRLRIRLHRVTSGFVSATHMPARCRVRIADFLVQPLRKLEEDWDVEPLVEIHADDCEVGNVSVSETFRGHEGLREFWTEYRKTFGEMKSTFRNVFATEEGAALEWTTEGTSNGDTVTYNGVSIFEIDGGKVRRFMVYFDPRALTPQVVD